MKDTDDDDVLWVSANAELNEFISNFSGETDIEEAITAAYVSLWIRLKEAKERITELEEKRKAPCKDCPGLGLMVSHGWCQSEKSMEDTYTVTVTEEAKEGPPCETVVHAGRKGDCKP